MRSSARRAIGTRPSSWSATARSSPGPASEAIEAGHATRESGSIPCTSLARRGAPGPGCSRSRHCWPPDSPPSMCSRHVGTATTHTGHVMDVRVRLRGVVSAYGGVIRSQSYFPLWLAQLLSSFGDTLHYIALVVLVFQLTGQGVAVVGLVAAEIVPVLLLGPVAGVIIDRFNRKAVLIGADLFRAVLVLSLLWPQGAWHAYVVAAGLAAGNTFFNPAVQAVIPTLTTDEQRLAANSVSWSTGRLVQIIASAVAAGLIGLIGT